MFGKSVSERAAERTRLQARSAVAGADTVIAGSEPAAVATGLTHPGFIIIL